MAPVLEQTVNGLQSRQEIYVDILKNSGVEGIENKPLDELENIMNMHSNQIQNRINVFIDMTKCTINEKKELLLDYIFINKPYEFSIFYQFLTTFLSPHIEAGDYYVLPADLQINYDKKCVVYHIQARDDISHKKIINHFKENGKFIFKNYIYDFIYSEDNKIISICFTKQ